MRKVSVKQVIESNAETKSRLLTSPAHQKLTKTQRFKLCVLFLMIATINIFAIERKWKNPQIWRKYAYKIWIKSVHTSGLYTGLHRQTDRHSENHFVGLKGPQNLNNFIDLWTPSSNFLYATYKINKFRTPLIRGSPPPLHKTTSKQNNAKTLNKFLTIPSTKLKILRVVIFSNCLYCLWEII